MKTILKFATLTLLFAISAIFSFSAHANDSESSVKRAIITTAIDAREPVDNFSGQALPAQNKKVFLFTEILNAANSNVTHRWFLNGKLEAEVVLKIGSDRWRTYSSKNLDSTFHTGNWEVMVVAADGTILKSQTFSY